MEINLSKIKLNSNFELADVADNWDSYTDGEKRILGKEFKEAVLSGEYPNVEFVDTRSDNHAIYIKR